MFMFNERLWKDNQDRFVQSYKTTRAVPRETGYAEMLSHRWLSQDHAVQETQFSNGVCVTVNFGDTPYAMENGRQLQPLGYHVDVQRAE